MANPIMNPTFAAAVAVDVGNALCRKRGGKPSNLGPWPAEEWETAEYVAYYRELIRCYKMFEPVIAQGMQEQFDKDYL